MNMATCGVLNAKNYKGYCDYRYVLFHYYHYSLTGNKKLADIMFSVLLRVEAGGDF